MYRAKARGGSVVHFYTPTLTEAVRQRVSVETELRRAMSGDELELYFQPIMAIDSQRVVGAEALLRWRAVGRGVLLPDSFLPIAELSGLIVQIGGHVIDLACRQLAAWREHPAVPRLSLSPPAGECMDDASPGARRALETVRQLAPSISILSKAVFS